MTGGEIAERLKDVADEIGPNCIALKATISTGADTWTDIEVHHAWLFSDSPDGWDVKITEGAL